MLVALALAAMVVPATAGASAGGNSDGRRLVRATPPSRVGTPSAIAAAAMRGALPRDADALAAAKRAAAARATAATAPVPLAVSPNPTVLDQVDGLDAVSSTPSDSTGAVGTTRYVETVNSRVRIYDKNLNTLSTDTLGNFWSAGAANVFDPQVIWDPTTKRFYYTGDIVVSGTDNRLAYGFSKTASPSNATTDWCHYNVSYGSDFPDYPKLGDSKFFAIIGVNVFTGNSYTGSDIVAIGKPPAGTTCPDPTSFPFGIGADIKLGGNAAFTPVPANEIDTNAVGYVVSEGPFTTNTAIGHFTVKRNSTTGDPIIQTAGTSVTVPSYSVPSNAPQKASAALIDTGDARPTQAVAAIDPRLGGLQIWTQHTVAGGAGARVRWYEINAAGATVSQTGLVQSSSLHVFNGGISPDRVVNGATKAFGSNMVMTVNTSSSTTFPAIGMVGKRGANSVSPRVTVKTSPGPIVDFVCPGSGTCRWGDYAAATPDPSASISAPTGIVWLTNQYTADGRITGTSSVSWRTWNWVATP
jgi:hypothetical protein